MNLYAIYFYRSFTEDKHKLVKHLDNLLVLFDKSFQSNSEQFRANKINLWRNLATAPRSSLQIINPFPNVKF